MEEKGRVDRGSVQTLIRLAIGFKISADDRWPDELVDQRILKVDMNPRGIIILTSTEAYDVAGLQYYI